MIRRAGRRRVVLALRRAGSVVLLLFLGFFCSGSFDLAFGMGAALRPGEDGLHTVAFVYDGDTVRTSEGLIIRYIGMGLGRSLIIPPCGTEKREELLGIETRAKEAGVGIWAK
jgi:endonuclease YncB( thermonuclease family)